MAPDAAAELGQTPHAAGPPPSLASVPARGLVLSPKTVRNHTEGIYAKTSAVNRVAASLFAVQHGLLPVD
jgi:hypothetical protein